MEILTLKIRISMLWIFMAVLMSASMIIYLWGPGVLEEIMAGEMEGMKISTGFSLFMALFWLIPLVMAFLSVTLRGLANYRTNLTLGIIFLLFYVFHLMGHIIQGNLPIDHLVMCVLTIVLPALVIYYAWQLPKQEA